MATIKKKKPQLKTEARNVRFTAEMWSELKLIAARDDRSIHSVIRSYCKDGIENRRKQ